MNNNINTATLVPSNKRATFNCAIMTFVNFIDEIVSRGVAS
jgi:hypothetical protein